MNTDYIKTYVKVVQCGSFTKAEEFLFVSKQAIIRQINQIEQELGTLLLVRSKQGIQMTSAGELFYQDSIKLLDMEKDMLSHARGTAGVTRRLRLSQIDYHVMLDPVTAAYQQQYPDVQIKKIFHKNTLEGTLVAQNVIDVGDTLYHPRYKKGELRYKGLLNMPYLCIMPQANAPESITPEALHNRQVVVHYLEFQDYYASHLKKLQTLLPQLEVITSNIRRVDMIYDALQDGKVVITASTFARMLNGCTISDLKIDLKQECGVVYRKNSSQEVLDYVHLACEIYRKK